MYPQGLAVSAEGLLVVADMSNHRVQLLNLSDGTHVRTIGKKGIRYQPHRAHTGLGSSAHPVPAVVIKPLFCDPVLLLLLCQLPNLVLLLCQSETI